MNAADASAGLKVMTPEQHGKVVAHLDSLLSSTEFASSKRCQQFLRYVVMEEVEGRAATITERQIASAVFGKGEEYDPTEHSLVRVKAIEVRKRLARFYEAYPASDVRIDLPSGSYVPVIGVTEPMVEVVPEPVVDVPPEKPGRRGWWIAAVAAGLVLVGLGWRTAGQPAVPPAELLWAPILSAEQTVLISLPSPDVYEYNAAGLPPDAALHASDLVLMRDYYTGRGAAFAAIRAAELLGRHHRSFEVKFGRDVTFSDLRKQPSVLLGLDSSYWTREMSSDMPFRQVNDESGIGFEDTAGDRKRWIRQRVSPLKMTEDFAMAARIVNSRTGHPLMIIAGLSARGTEAAAEMMTTPEFVEKLLHQMPLGWQGKNLQLILRAEVHGGTPGPPQLVASRVW